MKFFSVALSPFFAFLLLPFLSDSCLGLEVDCFFETDIKISCRCFGFDRDTVGQVRARRFTQSLFGQFRLIKNRLIAFN